MAAFPFTVAHIPRKMGSTRCAATKTGNAAGDLRPTRYGIFHLRVDP